LPYRTCWSGLSRSWRSVCGSAAGGAGDVASPDLGEAGAARDRDSSRRPAVDARRRRAERGRARRATRVQGGPEPRQAPRAVDVAPLARGRAGDAARSAERRSPPVEDRREVDHDVWAAKSPCGSA
jgi:hypothetical protein